jgi:hypothetical protein
VALRLSEPRHIATTDATARAVEAIAAQEIYVEFNPLIAEMYANRVALEKLLKQMDGGK